MSPRRRLRKAGCKRRGAAALGRRRRWRELRPGVGRGPGRSAARRGRQGVGWEAVRSRTVPTNPAWCQGHCRSVGPPAGGRIPRMAACRSRAPSDRRCHAQRPVLPTTGYGRSRGSMQPTESAAGPAALHLPGGRLRSTQVEKLASMETPRRAHANRSISELEARKARPAQRPCGSCSRPCRSRSAPALWARPVQGREPERLAAAPRRE